MARAKLPNGLTPKQETFALAFFKNGGNATQAYRTAYDTKSMSSKTVNECASRLVRDRRIAARLETLQRAVANRVEIKEAAILRNAYCAMMPGPRLILTPQGQFLPVDRWPEENVLAVDTFEVTELPGAAGRVSKVTFSSRAAAREQLMKYAGLFAKDNVQRSDGLADKSDGMTDESLAAMEDILESVLQDSDEDDIWEDKSAMGKPILN